MFVLATLKKGSGGTASSVDLGSGREPHEGLVSLVISRDITISLWYEPAVEATPGSSPNTDKPAQPLLRSRLCLCLLLFDK